MDKKIERMLVTEMVNLEAGRYTLRTRAPLSD